MRNLVTDDPYDAWREMMVTAESADRLKAAAGLKPGGRKNEQPVYVFALQWHPDDHPTKQHMLMAAVDCLRFMKMDERQAVIVEHTDTAHPHVHITVNMIHPETGRSVSLSKDEYKLDRWCDNYELKYGPIRSPERRAKFDALDQGLEPPPRTRQPKHRNDPALKAAIANDNTTGRARADKLKADLAAYQARIKATQEQAWKRRTAEARTLWNDYRTSQQAIRARHQFQMDKIYKHRRNRNALPLSIQGFRDWKETREWTALMKRLKAEKRRFDYRERTLFGFVTNTIGLIRPGMHRTGKGFLPMLFSLLVSGQARRELLLAKQGLAQKALSEKQFGSRKVRADRIRLIRDAQLATLSKAYDIQKEDLDRRHAQEIEKQKLDWKALSIERKKLWDEWKAEFGETQRRQRTDQGSSSGSGDSRARSPAPPRARGSFLRSRNKNPRAQPVQRPGQTGQKACAQTRRFGGQRGIHTGGEPGYFAIESRLEETPQRGRTARGRELQAEAAQGSVVIATWNGFSHNVAAIREAVAEH